MKKYIYSLLVLFAMPMASAQDALTDTFKTLTGGFNFSGIVGTLNLLLIILIVGTIAFLFVWTIYKMQKYKIVAWVVTQDNQFIRADSIGNFKDKSGVLYSKFRKTRERIDIDFNAIAKDRRRKQFVVMVKAGEGSYYQAYIPRKFYTREGKLVLPVIDPNVMRSAMTTLANQQRKYRLQDTVFQKYGTHIAILVVCLVLVVGGYILLRKEEQLIGLIKDLLAQTKGLQEALVNKAVGG